MVGVDPGDITDGGTRHGPDTGSEGPEQSPLVPPLGPAPRRRLLGRRTTPATATMDILTAGVRIAALLRDGLAAPAASGAAARLGGLLGADAVGLVDLGGTRTWAGPVPDGADALIA